MMEKKQVVVGLFVFNFLWIIHPTISLKLVQNNVGYKKIILYYIKLSAVVIIYILSFGLLAESYIWCLQLDPASWI